MQNPNFDTLCAAAHSAMATTALKDQLYAAVFKLEHWYFIGRGELPDVHPYVASNAGVGDGQPMLKAFTDTDKLYAFARENELLDADGKAQILSMPVATLHETLADYGNYGISGIHFNADAASNGFFAPLRQLPAIRAHLQRRQLL